MFSAEKLPFFSTRRPLSSPLLQFANRGIFHPPIRTGAHTVASRSRICSGENSRAGRFEVYSWEFITGIFVCQWDWGGCNITVTICGPAGGGGFFFAAAARRHRLKSCFRFAPASPGTSFAPMAQTTVPAACWPPRAFFSLVGKEPKAPSRGLRHP